LRAELERGWLTGRGYHRVRRVARTIADLEESTTRSSAQATSRSRSRCACACASPPVGTPRDTGDPPEAFAAALAALPLMTVHVCSRSFGTTSRARVRVASGAERPPLAVSWRG
jgi:hypothetical protein